MPVYVNIDKHERIWINQDGDETTAPTGVHNEGVARQPSDEKNTGRTAGVSPSA